MAQARHNVCGGDAEQFLVSIEAIPVFHREHAAKSGRFHHAEKKTTQREGQQIVEVGKVNGWKPEWRQPLWHLPKQFYAESTKIHARSDDDAGDDYEEGHRFVFEKSFP